MGKLYRPLPPGIFVHVGRAARGAVNAGKAAGRAAKAAARAAALATEHTRRATRAVKQHAGLAAHVTRAKHRDFMVGFRGR